ncbi:MAG: hypothetical protein HC810_03375 [Acaryochloridaceae cyanobacterium RL_2_7]|nr:hypothetical protein [Acaryochloridaceae cyanobacterium RL_2_7]
MSIALGAGAESPQGGTQDEVKLDERLQELDYFAREWTCMMSTQGSSEMANPYQWTVTKELNNYWLLGRGETNTGEHLQQDTFGYNTLFKQFGRTI